MKNKIEKKITAWIVDLVIRLGGNGKMNPARKAQILRSKIKDTCRGIN